MSLLYELIIVLFSFFFPPLIPVMDWIDYMHEVILRSLLLFDQDSGVIIGESVQDLLVTFHIVSKSSQAQCVRKKK